MRCTALESKTGGFAVCHRLFLRRYRSADRVPINMVQNEGGARDSLPVPSALMKPSRRTLLASIGGSLALPILESDSAGASDVAESVARASTQTRFLIVGNPFGMHPDHFFPKEFGRDFRFPRTLESLQWLRDRISIFSHTDHGMQSGHGREVAFLSGVLPETSGAFPEKNMSIDQLVARQTGNRVRFASINATLERSIRMSWNSNGVDIKPFTDPQELYDHLFLNLTPSQTPNSCHHAPTDGTRSTIYHFIRAAEEKCIQ